MDWSFNTGDANTRKAWHKKFTIEAKTESFFYENGLVGRTPGNYVFVEFPDLEKEQGDNITYGELMELSGSGTLNDGDMEGNEEVPDIYDDDITLYMQRNAIRTAGRMSMQRPSDKRYRMWAVALLKRWKASTVDQAMFTALGTSSTKALYGGDATSTATIEDGDYMTLYTIARAVAYGGKASPAIVGPGDGGAPTPGVCVMGLDQAFDLTERDAQWSDTRMSALMRGKKNPVFTRALGTHKDVPLHQHVRCPTSTTWGSGGATNGATAFFMGVNCGAIAYGKRWIWNEKTFDYSNKVGFCAGFLWGVSKTVYNSSDNALVELRTNRTNN